MQNNFVHLSCYEIDKNAVKYFSQNEYLIKDKASLFHNKTHAVQKFEQRLFY